MLLNAARHGLICGLSNCVHEPVFVENSFKQDNLLYSHASCVDW